MEVEMDWHKYEIETSFLDESGLSGSAWHIIESQTTYDLEEEVDNICYWVIDFEVNEGVALLVKEALYKSL